MFMMITSVAAGGAGGALSRFFLSRILGDMLPQTFFATLIVNLVGCFFIGLLSALFLHHRPPEMWKLLFITGFLGSFTTYSTFTLEALNLMLLGQGKMALFHIGAHLIGGLFLCLAGVQLAKLLTV